MGKSVDWLRVSSTWCGRSSPFLAHRVHVVSSQTKFSKIFKQNTLKQTRVIDKLCQFVPILTFENLRSFEEVFLNFPAHFSAQEQKDR